MQETPDLTFLVSSLLLLLLCWRQNWIPEGIIKGSFLRVPRLTSRRPLRITSTRPHLPPPHALLSLSETERCSRLSSSAPLFPPNLLSALIFISGSGIFLPLGSNCRVFVLFCTCATANRTLTCARLVYIQALVSQVTACSRPSDRLFIPPGSGQDPAGWDPPTLREFWRVWKLEVSIQRAVR